MENFQQVDLTNYATKLELQNAQTTLQNKITTNRTDIAYLKSHTVDTNTDQTINGIKTFAYKIQANGGITNLIEPTANNDAATKNYVDNVKNTLTTKINGVENEVGSLKIKVNSHYQVVLSETSTIYQNLNTINVLISNYVNSSNSLKS